jgi:hypothetical protein
LLIVSLGIVVVAKAVEQDIVDEVLRPGGQSDGRVYALGVADSEQDLLWLCRRRRVEEAEGNADAETGCFLDVGD